MFSNEILFGHSASHAPVLVQLPNPSSSICLTIFNTRSCFSICPCGNNANCETFAETNNIAEPFLQVATHAPHPIHAAALKASSASSLGIKILLASFAFPVLTETNVPGIYSILWTPPVGTSSKTFQAQIQISALETTNPQLDKAGSIKNVNIVVSQNNLLPTISGKSDLSAGVEEDRDTEFTVDVIDPSSLISPKLPTLDVTRYISSNTEAYRADGSRYIVFDDTREENPKKISETIYRFYFKVQVDRLPLDRDRLGKVIPSLGS